jgi:hypothetical protein
LSFVRDLQQPRDINPSIRSVLPPLSLTLPLSPNDHRKPRCLPSTNYSPTVIYASHRPPTQVLARASTTSSSHLSGYSVNPRF